MSEDPAGSEGSGATARVLLGISGGIAAYKSAQLVRELRAQGLEVRCALTRSAEQFVTPLTLEVLSGAGVLRQEYLTASGSGEELHVAAAQRADALCIAPATANILARLALGLADDFLSTTALMFEGPVIVAPAMHSAMWAKAATVDNVAALRDRGVAVVGPEEGELASGEVGVGRMAEPGAIALTVAQALRLGELSQRRVLVTAGPTFEPLGPVRFLGNRSSGKMGFALAAEAARRGARVTLVAGPVSRPTPAGVERIDVDTAVAMKQVVDEIAPQCDLVVMAAAVADYRPASASDQKLKKRRQDSIGATTLELVENPDILAGLAEVAPQAIRVGFAAETEKLLEHGSEKIAAKGVHLLVVNDVSRSDIGFGSDYNEVVLLSTCSEPQRLERATKEQLARQLVSRFAELIEELPSPASDR